MKVFKTNEKTPKRLYPDKRATKQCALPKKYAPDSFLRKTSEKTYAQKQSEVRRYAKIASQEIMDNLGGGTNLIYEIRNWRYFSHDKEYQIDLTVSYYGIVWSDTRYYLEGRLTVNQSTGKVNLATAFKNQAMKDLQRRLNLLNVGAALVDKILSEN